MAMVQIQWYHFVTGAPPILEPISVGIGMFTEGTFWLLTHGQVTICFCPATGPRQNFNAPALSLQKAPAPRIERFCSSCGLSGEVAPTLSPEGQIRGTWLLLGNILHLGLFPKAPNDFWALKMG